MVYCHICKCEVEVDVDDASGFSCCIKCGRVLEDVAFSADVTFQKDAGGESTVVGQFVSETGVARGIGRVHGGRVYAFQPDSHEKAQQRGRGEIAGLVDALSVRPREESVESAHRLYKLALQRGFTRGRRTNQVAAACLYLVCRQDAKPFLLIDFSDALQVNVYTLGSVFLQLARLLRLEEHPMFSRPVDPCLYIQRFADRLDFGQRRKDVANTALRLVASMKRDWIQTGRRPSGICGAALYIAAHIHGFERTKREVVGVVHVGEHTLSKRLYEFSSTSAGLLTAGEFETRGRVLDDSEKSIEGRLPAQAPPGLLEGTGCEHLKDQPHFAHGMCRTCCLDFIKASGGVYNGANPPAYDRARLREAEELQLLEGPEESEEEDDEEEEDEQQVAEIEDEMRLALEGGELQPFTAVLREHGEEEGEEEEEEEEAGPSSGGSRKRGRPRSSQGEEGEDGKGAGPGPGSSTKGKQQQQRGKKKKKKRKMTVAAMLARLAAMAESGDEQQQAGGSGQGGESAVAAAALAGTLPSQLSEQTVAALGGGTPSPTAAAASATPATTDGGEGLDPDAGAIVLVVHPQVEEEEAGEDTFSDISDGDVDMYIAEPEEARCKEEIWNMINAEWVEKQAQKRAHQEAADRAAAEQRAAMEAAAAAGVAYKRGRGRPLGSKTKPRPEASLPPAESAQEAAARMLDHRKLSSKINYSVLAELFSEGGEEGGEEEGREGEGDGAGPSGEGCGGGQESAVAAAMRVRAETEEAAAAERQARQAAALEAERGRRKPLGGLGSGGRGGPGGSRPCALGSLRDPAFRSSLRGPGGTPSGGGGASSKGGGASGSGAGSGKKSVRWAPPERP